MILKNIRRELGYFQKVRTSERTLCEIRLFGMRETTVNRMKINIRMKIKIDEAESASIRKINFFNFIVIFRVLLSFFWL